MIWYYIGRSWWDNHPVINNSLWSHGLQHARPPCPSPSLEICPSSSQLYQWWHPTISSSDALFSFCPQFFTSSRTFLVSRLFTSGDQNTGASTSGSVFPMSIQDWFPLRPTGLVSLQSKGLSGVFSSTTVQRHKFFHVLPSLQSSSHWKDHNLDYNQTAQCYIKEFKYNTSSKGFGSGAYRREVRNCIFQNPSPCMDFTWLPFSVWLEVSNEENVPMLGRQKGRKAIILRTLWQPDTGIFQTSVLYLALL